MDVIAFIEKDAGRARGISRFARALACAVIFGLPLALGILLREGYEGVFDAGTFVPNLLGALLVFAVSLAALGPRRFALRWLAAGVLLAVLLATGRVFFPGGARTAYASSGLFWHESGRCFTKGGLTTLAAGLWLTYCAFVGSAWPSRRWRVLLSAVAGASGVVMLGFHCDSSSIEHVLVAHAGQGVFLGAAVFAVQEAAFYLGLRRAFPELAERLRGLRRIG